MNLDYLDSCFFRNEGLKDCPEARIIVVDLTLESYKIISLPKRWLDCYVGGPALGMRLWADYSTDKDDNPIVLMSGNLSFSGIVDTDILSIIFCSPQNKQITTHTIRSDFSLRLRACGFAGIVITGRARRYSNVEIFNDGINVVLTEQFTHQLTSQIAKFYEGTQTSAIITGPGCEVKLPFACAVLDGKSTGRGGLGFLFESKNVRVLSVASDFERPVEKDSTVGKLVSQSAYCNRMKELGPYNLVENAYNKGWAPVDSFTKRTDPRMFYLTPPEIKRRGKENPDSFIDSDSILMLGPNSCCFDIGTIRKRYELCLDLGLDPLSVGNIVGGLKAGCSDIGIVLNAVCFEGQNLPKSKLAVNGLECGGTDYRGAFATALNDALGNSFTIEFEKGLGVCSKDPAMWVVFSEDLVYGLETFGFLPQRIVPALWDSKSAFLRKKYELAPSGLYSMISDECFADLGISANDIINIGKICWRLKYEINRMRNTAKPMLPDYFCVNPDSNCSKKEIVPLFSLIQRYNKLRQNTVVCQSTNLN